MIPTCRRGLTRQKLPSSSFEFVSVELDRHGLELPGKLEWHLVSLRDRRARVKPDVESFVERDAVGDAFLDAAFTQFFVIRKQCHGGTGKRLVGVCFVDSLQRHGARR